MARAIWTGSLSFGLVNVPVALYSATEDRSIRFHQFQAGTADRIRQKRVNERTGEEVPYNEVVKGYDLGGDEFVLVTPEELAAVAPGRSKTIDVTAFVELSEIDPLYFDHAYYLAPPDKKAVRGTEKAYALLAEAMRRSGKVALATFVLREKQYLCAVRATDEVLVLETLLYADEIREPMDEISTLPVEGELNQRELEMAAQLIDSMAAPWEPEKYHDDYRAHVEDLIEQKRAGAVVNAGGAEPQAAPVVDLMKALEESVRARRDAETAPKTRVAAATPVRRAVTTRVPATTGDSDLADLSKADLQQRAPRSSEWPDAPRCAATNSKRPSAKRSSRVLNAGRPLGPPPRPDQRLIRLADSDGARCALDPAQTVTTVRGLHRRRPVASGSPANGFPRPSR